MHELPRFCSFKPTVEVHMLLRTLYFVPAAHRRALHRGPIRVTAHPWASTSQTFMCSQIIWGPYKKQIIIHQRSLCCFFREATAAIDRPRLSRQALKLETGKNNGASLRFCISSRLPGGAAAAAVHKHTLSGMALTLGPTQTQPRLSPACLSPWPVSSPTHQIIHPLATIFPPEWIYVCVWLCPAKRQLSSLGSQWFSLHSHWLADHTLLRSQLRSLLWLAHCYFIVVRVDIGVF